MPEVIQEVTTPQDQVDVTSEQEVRETPEQSSVTDTPEPAAETDEQKNERVQREANEKAQKRARGVQKRIDELTAEKHSERQRSDDLIRQNAELTALLKGQGNTPNSAPKGEPTQDQFTDYADFITARATWNAEQKVREILTREIQANQQRQTQFALQQAEQTAIRTYSERAKETAKSIPDFEETMADADVPIPLPVLRMIREMEDGPVIAYHMIKNTALAQKFFTTPPSMHGILLGQLSATLKGSAKVSNAPPPGKTVQSKAGSSTEPPSDPDKYFEWAEKHMR